MEEEEGKEVEVETLTKKLKNMSEELERIKKEHIKKSKATTIVVTVGLICIIIGGVIGYASFGNIETMKSLSSEDTRERVLSLIYQATELLDEVVYWCEEGAQGTTSLTTISSVMKEIKIGFEHIEENIESLEDIAHTSYLETIHHFKLAAQHVVKACGYAENLDFETATFYMEQATAEIEKATEAVP